MNYTKRAVKGASVTFVMGFLAAVVAYMTRIILARTLGPQDYGLFSSILTFILFFLFFRDLGLNQSVVRYVSKYLVDNDKSKIKTTIFSVLSLKIVSSFVFITIIFFLSKYLAANYFSDQRASLALNLFIFYIIFSIFFILQKGTFQGFQRMFLFSSVEFVKNLTFLVLVLLFFWKGYKFFSPILAYSLVSVIIFIFYLPSVYRIFPFLRYKITSFSSITKKVFLFGAPLFLNSIAAKFIGYTDTLILTYSGTLSEVGIYNVVLPSALILLYFGRAVSSIAFPMSSELWARKDMKRLREGVRIIQKYSFVVMVPIIFTLVIYSRFFITLFFGREYASGTLAFQILLVGMLLFTVAMVNNSIISAIGKPKTVAGITISAAILNVILNLVLIPSFGILGAALATTLSYTLILIISTYMINKNLQIKFPAKEWGLQLFATISFITAIILSKELFNFSQYSEMIVSITISVLSYILAINFLKIIDLKEIKRYLRLLR